MSGSSWVGVLVSSTKCYFTLAYESFFVTTLIFRSKKLLLENTSSIIHVFLWDNLAKFLFACLYL
jgi:hypothetical protein